MFRSLKENQKHKKKSNTEYLLLSDTSKSQKFYEIATIIICILQMGKLRHRKIK